MTICSDSYVHLMQWHAATVAIKCNSVIGSYYQPNVVIHMCNEVHGILELIATAIKVNFFHITKYRSISLTSKGGELEGDGCPWLRGL